jgi:toxin-antitoxin system PIN domain toxin
MIALDTNVLVHAHRRESPQHEIAASVVRELAESSRPWALPWPCIHEFLAVVTRRRYFDLPSTVVQATRQVELWMASPSVRVLAESPVHWRTLRRVLDESSSAGVGIHDAKIAAICIDHGVREIISEDGGFSRLPSLRARNPFA